MNKFAKSFASIICGIGLLPLNASAQGWPSKYQGVMLQGFYWDSFDRTQWSQLEADADELSQYFRLVWVPQSASCGGKSMGYNDLYWFTNYNSSFGSEEQLRSMIKTFKAKGIGTIADVVVNHRGTLKDWFDFPTETYGGKTYSMTAADVCADDDGGKAAAVAKNQGVSLSANKDTGDDFGGMRDLDHNSANVQATVKDYLHMLLSDLGYAGFRYDMVKGYAGNFTGMYNASAQPEFSVGEYFDDNKSRIISWLSSTKVDGKVMSAAFDFPMRYSVRDAANGGVWSKLDDGGLATNNTYKRYAVTFVENHDTEKRSASEQQDPIRKDTLAANAFMLAMPGTPCVFYKHWTDCKKDIKTMILLRSLAGINNQSDFNTIESGTSRYVFSATGTNATLLAAVGTSANAYKAPAGYALAADGYHWRYFLPASLNIAWPELASGEYSDVRVARVRAISADADAKIVYTLDGSEPTASNGTVVNGSAADVELPLGTTVLKVALLSGGKVSEVQTRTYSCKDFKPYSISLYVNTENVGWDNAYFWTWGGSGHAPVNAEWPGDNVTTLTEKNGKTWYAKSFDITYLGDYLNVVIAKDKSTQTVDVNGISQDTYLEVLADKDDQGHYLVKNVTAEQPAAIAGVADDMWAAQPTCVVAIDGRVVRRFVEKVADGKAVRGLAPGLYVVNGKKIAVK